MVGRSREREIIDEEWDGMRAAARRVLLIGGAPGVGKTRLVAEAASAAHEQGAIVGYGRCFSQFGAPFQPFLEILDGLIPRGQNSMAFDLPGDTLDQVERLRGSLESSRTDDTTQGRHTMFQAIVRVFIAAAKVRPLVLVIDDIHWATDPTLQLLVHTVRSTGSERLLLLATFRSTTPDRTPELMNTTSNLYRYPGVSRIDLDGLSVEEIAEFVAARTSRPTNAILGDAAMLRDVTGGNPFFLRETLTSLEHAPTRGVPDPRRVPLPVTVGDAIKLRLSALSQPHVHLLAVAAIGGPEIDASLVAEVAEVTATDAEELLDTATATGLVSRTSGHGYTFAHDLARRALVDTLDPSDRRRFHALYGATLAPRLDSSPGLAATIAHHYEASGGSNDRAVHFRELAGRHAESVLAFEEAANHFEQAADQSTGPRSEELILCAAGNLVDAAAFRGAQDMYLRVRDTSDPVLRAQAALGFADASWRPGHLGHESVAVLTEALRRIDAQAQPALDVRLRIYLSRALGYAGQHRQASDVGDAALADARQLADQRTMAQALIYPIFTADETNSDTWDRIDEATRIVRALNDYDFLGHAAYLRGVVAYVLGRRTAWDDSTSDLAHVADITGQPLHRAALANATTARLFVQGRFNEALGVNDSLLDLSDAFGEDGVEGLHGSATYMIRRETGLDDIRQLITGDPDSEPGTWKLGLLAIYTELEMARPAKVLLKELAPSYLIDGVAGRYRGAEAAYLTEAVAFTKDKKLGAQLYEVLLPRSGTNLISGHFINVFGSADRYLGMLAPLCGRNAGDHFEGAIEMDAQMGDVVHEAESLARYARYLRASDSGRATELAHRALSLATQLGGQRVQRLATWDSPPSSGQLTARELDVLRLVAQGMSNKQISAKLFISNNTAANHVRSILIKTGSANRTQAARYAADMGLSDD